MQQHELVMYIVASERWKSAECVSWCVFGAGVPFRGGVCAIRGECQGGSVSDWLQSLVVLVRGTSALAGGTGGLAQLGSVGGKEKRTDESTVE